MKKFLKIGVVSLLVVFALASCNLFQTPTQNPVEQTPNLTLTALFDTSNNIPPTVTPPVIFTTVPELPTVAPTAVPTTAVPTLVPTATAVPPTAIPAPKVRSGEQMKAYFLTTAPVMDGTYEEWVAKTVKYKLPYVVWGPKNWKDRADLEGAFAAGWDATYLYVSVKVSDDSYNQRQQHDAMYKGDSVELLIDTNLLGDFYVQGLDSDDYQLGLSAGNAAAEIAKEAYLWYPAAVKGTRSQVIVSSVFETSPIYRIEAAIPWSMLGITPTNGMRLGFAVSINDNDSATENLQQTMISTAANRNFLDPTTWGEIILIK
jgi:hypothetical protein